MNNWMIDVIRSAKSSQRLRGTNNWLMIQLFLLKVTEKRYFRNRFFMNKEMFIALEKFNTFTFYGSGEGS
jgi:hypothetical protein